LIWGSTNQPRYIKDDSGGRRFWGVKCANIDLDGLRRDRDQLFAEAVVMFRAGVPWHPDREFEQMYVRPQQASRQQTDEWLNIILRYFEVTQTPPFDLTKVRIADIWAYPLGQLGHPISRGDQGRISALLHHQLKAPSGHDRRGTWYNLKAVL
jgi:predicted P-loop ATPase